MSPRALRYAILLLAPCLPGVAAAQSGGKITSASGAVHVLPNGGSERLGRSGDAVEAGARVRTGPDGQAEIVLDDGSRLQLRPNTSVMLSGHKRQAKQKSSVVLFFGRVWSKVTRSSSGETNYEVSTPNAVAGVRGTEFETAVGEDGSVRVRVSEGKVAVGSDAAEDEEEVAANQEVHADESGVDDSQAAAGEAGWEQWSESKRERVRTKGADIVSVMKNKLLSRKQKLERLRARQQEIEKQRKGAEKRLRSGDSKAADAIRGYNSELALIADAIADLGDAAHSQFGYVDHLAELAADPRFKMVNAKMLAAEAGTFRRLREQFDKMVKEGTDISIEAMDEMLDDMSGGKRGSLKDKKGSSVDDMFGGDDMDMKP